MFMVSDRTAKKWADRYRHEGPAGRANRALHNPGCSWGLKPPDSSSDLAM